MPYIKTNNFKPLSVKVGNENVKKIFLGKTQIYPEEAYLAIWNNLKTPPVEYYYEPSTLTLNDLTDSLKFFNASDRNTLTSFYTRFDPSSPANPTLGGALYLQNCSNLLLADCSGIILSSLSIQNCSKLTDLYCSLNDLSSLDLTGLIKLKNLEAKTNKIKTVNFAPSISSLESINLNNNLLTGTLAISSQPKLILLDVSNNSSLTTIQLTNTPLIQSVLCGATSITTITLNNNSAFASFDSQFTPTLKTLNLSGCNSLLTVDSNNCSLTSVNLSGCNNLEYVRLYSNQLSQSQIDSVVNVMKNTAKLGTTKYYNLDGNVGSITPLQASQLTSKNWNYESA